MPRRYEDRYVIGGRPVPVRWDDSEQRWLPGLAGEERGPVPKLPPLHGTRATPYEAGHEPLSIVHVHAHGDGHGRQHSHLHAHANDSHHSGASHEHAPGSPGPGAPEVGLNSQDPGGEVSGIGLAEQITRFLQGQGVDVAAALQDAQYAREHAGQRARQRMETAGHIAYQLRKAKRALLVEQEAFCSRRSGSGIALVAEAQQRVDMLTAALAEACVDDPELIAEAKRRAAR